MKTILRTTLAIALACGLSVGAFAQQGGHSLGFSSSASSKVTVPLLVPNDFLSLEAWVYFNGSSYSNGTGRHTIMEFGDDTPWFGVNSQGQLELYNIAAGGRVPMRAWTHVAYTWNLSVGTLYINGVQVATSNQPPWTLPTANVLGIGHNTGDTGWQGYIDEVMVWNDGRTASQVMSDMQSGVTTPQARLLAYYKFENVTGQTLANQVTGGPAGTLGSTNAVEANDPTVVTSVITGTRKTGEVAQAQLQPSYPNPFRNETNITFTLERATPVRLTVLDVTGRVVATLLDEKRAAGTYTVPFRGSLRSGLYRYQLTTEGQTVSRTMLVQ
ncbi:T9SS C-terminal target domain-containing protein [Hymenobacter oligotrophus]|uniref:T9SS C-terminal target domain-containing protein n=1 Tax=Hymenobacter oligotrophus TaxID=2319843 RepID=A0A3B7QXV7_9BACT|nr:LamG-like jellyroll fold domain-containing protein [Hymenobacter oligotrophus]AYA35920.1 T9SS C-terminal target domain-containing protein [Hymenobacter oligotrophus]